MLKVEHVQKKYNDFCLDCSFNIPDGTITGLIGKNGSGKTTAFKIILGLLKPDSGEVKLFDKSIDNITLDEKQKIAAVLADSGFHSDFTPNDLIAILKNLYSNFDENYYFWELKRQNLPLKKRIKDFSLGMVAKLKLIIALSVNPKLLILDEPTLGLDVSTRNETFDKLNNFMDEDDERSIIISSHNSKDLESICDFLILLNEGKVLLYEETDKILSEYAILKVSKEQFNSLNKNYILRYNKKFFGFSCLTNQKQFYLDNYPDIVIEPGTIDEVLTMMTEGESL